MTYIQTVIDGVWIINPKVFPDSHDCFFKVCKKEEFETNIGVVNLIQDNESQLIV